MTKKSRSKAKSNVKSNGTTDKNTQSVPIDPIFSFGTGETLEKYVKQLVRTSMKRCFGSNIFIMYKIILDLLKYHPTMVEFGIKYAIEELNIKITFNELVVYTSENKKRYADQTDIISKIMGFMVIMIGPDWLPESIFNVVEELIQTKKIISYKSIEYLIMYVMDCGLDVPSPKIIDEMIKSTQCKTTCTPDALINYITANCNLYDKDGYLDYLENEKSVGLTQWFHPPAEHQPGGKLEHFILMQSMWVTRIIVLSEYTSCVDIWSRFFRMFNTLAINNEKFLESMTFKISIRQLMINYAYKFEKYKYLHLFVDKMNTTVKQHLRLSDNICNYDTYIFDPKKYRYVWNKLVKRSKKMLRLRMWVLQKSIKSDTKHITIRILHMIYGDKLCHTVRTHDRSLMRP